MKPFFGEPRLLIGGRRRTKLLEGLKRQRELVRAALADSGQAVPVQACFCFLNPADQSGGSGLPVLRTPRIEDVPLLVPRKLSRSLSRPGELDAGARERVAELLAAAFPRA